MAAPAPRAVSGGSRPRFGYRFLDSRTWDQLWCPKIEFERLEMSKQGAEAEIGWGWLLHARLDALDGCSMPGSMGSMVARCPARCARWLLDAASSTFLGLPGSAPKPGVI